MATSTATPQLCVKCPKSHGQAMCAGCGQWFCRQHFNEHHTELSGQMDELTVAHDQLQHDLIGDDNDRQHPLLARVDRWESDAIARIRQVANEVRQQLRNLFCRSKRHVEESLRPIGNDMQEKRQTENYTEIDLTRWMTRLKELRRQLNGPSTIEVKNDQVPALSTDIPLIKLSLAQERVPPHITERTRWSTNGQTVAGGHEEGGAANQLHFPWGLEIDDEGSLYIADTDNHRIVRWRPDAAEGETIAGGKGLGNRPDQLNQPLAVLIDRLHDCLIVSDGGNRRVMRWPLQKSAGAGEVILSNTHSLGLAMDDEGSLYVSDWDKDEIRRYGPEGGREGGIVAGGHGKGAALDQLDRPRQIFVDSDQSVFVSDTYNHRVVKWVKGAREGVVVAGGQGQGNSLAQLNGPSGIFVDRMGSIYVADQGNDRVMRWTKGAKDGEVLVGGNGRGSKNEQFNQPASISLDERGNLYVVDRDNHRVQCFDLQ